MARRSAAGPGSCMTRAERITGFCYLPFYLFLLALFLKTVLPLIGFPLEPLTLNLVFYAVQFAAVLLIFHRFLAESWKNARFWTWLQGVILGLALYFALSFALQLIMRLLSRGFVNPNQAAVEELLQLGGVPMLLCAVLVGPLVEEVFLRGLIFGSLHRKSRFAAYCVSVLVFCAMHLWQSVGQADWQTILFSALQYAPGGIALCWTYEKSETIWGPVALHCLINAIAAGLLALLRQYL